MPPSFLQNVEKLLRSLAEYLANQRLMEKPPEENTVPLERAPTLEDLAFAVKSREGFGSPGAKTITEGNNPGALRWSPFMTDQKHGFAYFDTYEQGWKALLHQLRIVCNGTSPLYNAKARALGYKSCGELSLKEFFHIYSPESDGNDSNAYADFVAARLHVTVEYRLKDIIS